MDLVDKSQNVSKLRRFLGFLADFFVVVIFVYLLGVIANFLIRHIELIYLEVTAMLLTVAFFFAYYILLEYYFQKTVGKFLTGTRVVYDARLPDSTDAPGRPPLGAVVKRTFARLIPIDPFTCLFSRKGLHDRLSKTRVVLSGEWDSDLLGSRES